MKKIIFTIILITVFSFTLFSQVKMGEQNGLILQIDSETKGVLFPIVALTNRNSQTPLIGTVPTGTFIFNTNTFGDFPYEVTPGFFWWDNENSQWNPLASSRENFTAKFTNVDFGEPIDGANNDYYDGKSKNMKIFGNIVFNENYEALQKDRDKDDFLKFNYSGLYAISVVLSLNKFNKNPAIALKVNLALNDKPVGISHYVRSSAAVTSKSGRFFSNCFTEYIEVKEGDILTLKSVRATLQDPKTYKVNFDQLGSSSITISRIR